MTTGKVNGKTLVHKILEAGASVGRLEKDKRNDHFKYDYLSEEAVKAAANRACSESGVWPKSIRISPYSDEMVTGKRGSTNLVKCKATIEFDDGIVYEGLGSGMDQGDKALMKAQTAALREAWKNCLIIASGHDPEEEPNGNGQEDSSTSEMRLLLSEAKTDKLLAKWVKECSLLEVEHKRKLWVGFRSRCESMKLDPMEFWKEHAS
jgi:hypothetical protein